MNLKKTQSPWGGRGRSFSLSFPEAAQTPEKACPQCKHLRRLLLNRESHRRGKPGSSRFHTGWSCEQHDWKGRQTEHPSSQIPNKRSGAKEQADWFRSVQSGQGPSCEGMLCSIYEERHGRNEASDWVGTRALYYVHEEPLALWAHMQEQGNDFAFSNNPMPKTKT